MPRRAAARLKQALRGLARLPDRLLHGRRRDRARDRLRAVGSGTYRVVFVCHGNICRSPFAEGIFRSVLPPGLSSRTEVSSTGFHPAEGRESPPEAVASAGRRGVDLHAHRSRSLAPGPGPGADLDGALVFVMEPSQRRRLLRSASAHPRAVVILGDLDPEPIRRRGIRDPYGASRQVFDEVFGRIERCVGEAARVLADRK